MRGKRFAALFLALLLTLGALPAALAEEPPEESGIPEKVSEAEEIPEPGETPEPEEAPAETEEFEPFPDPEPTGVFQNGAMEGPQTIPGEPMTAALDWEGETYQAVLDGWRERRTEIDTRDLNISSENWDAFWVILEKVLNDHPEFFYADWYRTNDRWSGGRLQSLELVYRNLSAVGTTLDQAVRDFDAAAGEAMAEIQGVTDPVEKALLLHDWLVTRCAYNWTVATEGQGAGESDLVYTAYGPLVNKDAVCQGYALAYKYLLNRAGIDAVYLSSSDARLRHGWNGVLINGKWYHVDTTWDDPVPNKEGRCSHDYFLLSDETITDENHKHFTWKPSLSCADKTYETGWAFNGVNLPFYRRDGAYYYVKELDRDWKTRVFRTSRLDQPGIQLTEDLGLTTNDGAVWLDGLLYLIPSAYVGKNERVLLVYDLDAGLTAQAALFPFTASPSPNGQYGESADRNPGLRYNAETREIEAVSSTRREVVAAFPARALSGGWTQAAAPEDGLALAPGLSKDGAAALLYAEGAAAPEGASLWAAFYQGERLAALRSLPVPERVELGVSNILPPLVLAYPGLSDLPKYDSVRLMLLTGDGLAPLCAAG